METWRKELLTKGPPKKWVRLRRAHEWIDIVTNELVCDPRIRSSFNLGRTLSDETRQKMSDYQSNRTAAHRAAIGSAHKGKIVSEETKAKLRVARAQRPEISDETRQKMAESHKGKKNPWVTKLRKGKARTSTVRSKIAATMAGRVFSDEHKAKLKISWLKRKGLL